MEKSATETELQESTDKLACWTQHFLEWEQSGETQTDFCKNNNLSHAKFCYWRYYVKRAMRQKKSKKTENKQFVPVKIKANQPASHEDKPIMTIRLPNGVAISIPPRIEPSQHELIMQLLRVKS